MNWVIEFLSEHGPSTREEIGIHSVSPNYRMDSGIRRVKLRSNWSGSSKGRGQQIAVYYLEGVHDPTAVVHKYIEMNPEILRGQNTASISQFFGDHSAELQDGWRAVSGEYDVEVTGGSRTGEQDPGPCPLCGADDFRDLSSHLPECPER